MDALYLNITAHRAITEASEAIEAARAAIDRAVVAASAAHLCESVASGDMDAWETLDKRAGAVSDLADALDVLRAAARVAVSVAASGDAARKPARKRARK